MVFYVDEINLPKSPIVSEWAALFFIIYTSKNTITKANVNSLIIFVPFP